MPHDGSSAITSYQILIRQSDELTYSEESVNCDGAQLAIHTSLECQVPIAKLIVAPYNLPWGANIHATVSAINVIGASLHSDAGNGAIILTNPEAPFDLENVPATTAKH